MKWEDLRDLINALVDERKITQKWIADQLHTDPGLIGDWLRGLRIPRDRSIEKLKTALRAAGFLDEQAGAEQRPTAYRVLERPDVYRAPENTVTLPLLAGIPEKLPEYSEKDIESFAQLPRYIFPGADFIIPWNGEGMEPEITRDAYCIIHRENTPKNNAIMLVKTGEGVTLGRVVKAGDKTELHLPDRRIILPGELTIIGEVIGTWNRIKPK